MVECDVCMKTVENRYNVSGYGCCIGLFCNDCKSRLQKCPYCRSDIVIETTEMEAIKDKASKYEKLVWFARAGTFTDALTQHEKQKIIDEFPNEVEELRDSVIGDWTHGFNSGVLAAMRYVLTALDKTLLTDDDDKEYRHGGVTVAEEEFPNLDT